MDDDDDIYVDGQQVVSINESMPDTLAVDNRKWRSTSTQQSFLFDQIVCALDICKC